MYDFGAFQPHGAELWTQAVSKVTQGHGFRMCKPMPNLVCFLYHIVQGKVAQAKSYDNSWNVSRQLFDNSVFKDNPLHLLRRQSLEQL